MADIESFNHGGISVPDVREGQDFYEKLLGAQHCNRIAVTGADMRNGRGNPHNCVVLGDYLFVLFAHRKPSPVPDQPRGMDGSRRGFFVSRERFAEIVDQARNAGIEFEGPVTHPEHGPLGESIYFYDPGGNFLEICWRRDAKERFNPVMVLSR